MIAEQSLPRKNPDPECQRGDLGDRFGRSAWNSHNPPQRGRFVIWSRLVYDPRKPSALVEHLKKQKASAIINVSSVLGFVPLAVAAVYSSTKAALDSYSQSLRYKLAGSPARALELAPPWVQTDLLNSSNEPRAMPLAEFIDETIKVLGSVLRLENPIRSLNRVRWFPPGNKAVVSVYHRTVLPQTWAEHVHRGTGYVPKLSVIGSLTLLYSCSQTALTKGRPRGFVNSSEATRFSDDPHVRVARQVTLKSTL